MCLFYCVCHTYDLYFIYKSHAFWGGFLSSAQRSELIFVYQCLCSLLYCLYISFNVNIIWKILTKLRFSLWVCPTFGGIAQQNRKSPSTVLTAHNGTGNHTFMRNNVWYQSIGYRSSFYLIYNVLPKSTYNKNIRQRTIIRDHLS